MQRNVVLSPYNRTTYLDQAQVIMYIVKTCSQVLFAHAIYHTSKHVCACVGTCTCNRMPLLKRPEREKRNCNKPLPLDFLVLFWLLLEKVIFNFQVLKYKQSFRATVYSKE